MITPKQIVFLIALVSFIASCFYQFFDKMNSIYAVNFIAETVFISIFLRYRSTKARAILIFWISFYLAAVAIYLNHNIAYGKITTGLKLIGYIGLILYIFPKQKKIKFDKLDFLVYSLVFIANVYVVYEVVKMVSRFVSAKHMIVLYACYGIILISLYILAFRYRLLYDSRSKYVLLLAAFLTAAEILGILAYFLKYEFLYYFENFFYLFGLSFGVIAFIDENKKGRLHRLIKTGSI